MKSIRTGNRNLVPLAKPTPTLVLGEPSEEKFYTEMAYEKELRFCAKHGIICLEYHRRHGVRRRKCSGQSGQGGQESSP